MDAYECIISKRDLRTYDDRPIAPRVLRRILEAGRRSGSARNQQPWAFVVVTDRSVLGALARCGLVARHLSAAAAAVVIVIDHPKHAFDAGRCAQSMMLAAWSHGIASCPVALQRIKAARAALGVPPDRTIAVAIAMGYPDARGRSRLERLALRLVARRGRKPLSTLAHWNKYGAKAVVPLLEEDEGSTNEP